MVAAGKVDHLVLGLTEIQPTGYFHGADISIAGYDFNTRLDQWVFKNGVQQHSVGGAPGEGEYQLVGTTLTITLAGGDILDVYEWS